MPWVGLQAQQADRFAKHPPPQRAKRRLSLGPRQMRQEDRPHRRW